MDRRSDRETDPAAAAGCCIGIAHHELGAGQIIDEGDLRALEEGQGDGVNERGLAVGLDADVVGLGSLDQFEAILEAGAAAAVDSDAEDGGSGDDVVILDPRALDELALALEIGE